MEWRFAHEFKNSEWKFANSSCNSKWKRELAYKFFKAEHCKKSRVVLTELGYLSCI